MKTNFTVLGSKSFGVFGIFSVKAIMLMPIVVIQIIEKMIAAFVDGSIVFKTVHIHIVSVLGHS